jgi:LacI family gluconate utilization system Gnt-I transcriptional repressor
MASRNPAARRARRRTGAAATVHDVARLAEVSAITVSRALNRPEQLSTRTLERVRAAIARTGYTPNLVAGALRAAKSRVVAAVVPTVAGPVFLDTVQSLTDALDAKGYQLLLGQGGYGASREDALLDAIIGSRPAGIVLTGFEHSPEGRQRLQGARIPVVETWDLGAEPIDMAVGFDHRRIGAAVCDFLWAAGRRHLALVSGDDERARRRAAAFIRRARKLGAAQDPAVHWIPAPTTLAAGRAGLAHLLAEGRRIDAIFCSSDLVALGVLTEAHARGIEVPGRLAVVGFGDLPFSSGVMPAITTVSVDGARIGAIAAAMIIDRAEGRRVDKRIVDVGFTLVRRATA